MTKGEDIRSFLGAPFYINLNNDSYVINCKKNYLPETYISYLINNNEVVFKNEVKPKNNDDRSFFLPTLFYKDDLYSLISDKTNKWQKFSLNQNKLTEDTTTQRSYEVFGFTDTLEILGYFDSLIYVATKDKKVMCFENKNLLWEKNINFREGNRFLVTSMGLVFKPDQNIYLLNARDGVKKLIVDGKSNEQLSANLGVTKILIYCLNPENIVFSTCNSDSPIYCFNINNNELVWSQKLKEYYVIDQSGWHLFNIPFLNTTWEGYTFIIDEEHIYTFKNDQGLINTHILKKNKRAINFFMRNNKLHIVTALGEIHIYNPEDLI